MTLFDDPRDEGRPLIPAIEKASLSKAHFTSRAAIIIGANIGWQFPSNYIHTYTITIMPYVNITTEGLVVRTSGGRLDAYNSNCCTLISV